MSHDPGCSLSEDAGRRPRLEVRVGFGGRHGYDRTVVYRGPRSLQVGAAIAILLAGASGAQTRAALDPYEACLQAVVEDRDFARRTATCQQAAEAGIPAAQYLLGMLLLEGEDSRPHIALRWLRLAAERGHPAAQHEVAGLLRDGVGDAGRPDPAAADDYLGRAACAGFPAALLEADERGTAVECPETTWSGSWSGELAWIHSSLAEEPGSERRITVRLGLGDRPRVETLHDGEWVESKPGAFRWVERGPNALVIALEDGWDLDGRWTETSSFALVRTAEDALEVAWTRILHNEHMPETLEGRTLVAVARGTLELLPE